MTEQDRQVDIQEKLCKKIATLTLVVSEQENKIQQFDYIMGYFLHQVHRARL
jgi:hypothetical protein